MKPMTREHVISKQKMIELSLQIFICSMNSKYKGDNYTRVEIVRDWDWVINERGDGEKNYFTGIQASERGLLDFNEYTKEDLHRDFVKFCTRQHWYNGLAGRLTLQTQRGSKGWYYFTVYVDENIDLIQSNSYQTTII